jgi:putative peptide zinc metalloprotease protein
VQSFPRAQLPGMPMDQPMDELEKVNRAMALPPLRDDLSLHPGPSRTDGAPTWMIEDPLRGRFYRIGWIELEILVRWAAGDAREVVRRVSAETLLRPEVEEVIAVRQFLLQHELAMNPERVAAVASGKAPRPGMATRALHNYLMFRIPLFNPERFLGATLPLARPLLGAGAWWLSVMAGMLGLMLALQQWDVYLATFVDTLSLSGLASYAVAFIFAKFLHELGHAYTAKSLGLRVPRIGVAIVLLFPMLYTDTGETWRLPRQADRFRIAAAGMRIELMLACWSTLAWSFLPEGPLRGACFFLATTSWLVTLAINASPFLRFDGYYMLSDASGIPNLHDEATKALRHFLRASLLGLPEPKPTVDGQEAPRWILPFGIITAIYRFFLFAGIAVAVYHFFFKALGIFLFIVEIWWFILRPVFNELAVWWKSRRGIRFGPALRLFVLLAALVGLLFVPWQDRVFAEGWVRAAQDFAVYSPRPATLMQRPTGGPVAPGDRIATLEAPDLSLREARAVARIGTLDSRLTARPEGDAPADSARATRAQLAQQLVEVQGAAVEARQLMLLAPFAGEIVDVAHDAMPGLVVSRQEPLARVVDRRTWIAEIFVDEDDVRRLSVGASVRAWLHGVAIEWLEGRVESIDAVPVEQLPSEMLAAPYGGRLVVTEEPNSLKPRRSLYRVRCAIHEAPVMQQARLATFVLGAEPMSLADRLWRGVMSGLALQTNF